MEQTMRKTAMTHAVLLSLMSATSLFSQAPAPAATAVPNLTPSSTPIPKPLVYAHFLAMVNDLDMRAAAAGVTDPYQFAQPFSRAGFANNDLDALRNEARALTADLAAEDQKAKAVIAAFRASAQAAAQQAQPLPPPQLSQLQAERNAIVAYHIANLQATLGPATTARLETYFTREVAPHVSLKALARAPADPNSPAAPQSSGFPIQP
jgi:hypothetical protein